MTSLATTGPSLRPTWTPSTKGSTLALINLASMYENGRGTKLGRRQGRRTGRKAHAAGWTLASINLGFIYNFGELGEPDTVKGRFWFEKGVEAKLPQKQWRRWPCCCGREAAVPRTCRGRANSMQRRPNSAMSRGPTAFALMTLKGEGGPTDVRCSDALYEKAARRAMRPPLSISVASMSWAPASTSTSLPLANGSPPPLRSSNRAVSKIWACRDIDKEAGTPDFRRRCAISRKVPNSATPPRCSRSGCSTTRHWSGRATLNWRSPGYSKAVRLATCRHCNNLANLHDQGPGRIKADPVMAAALYYRSPRRRNDVHDR